MKERLLPPTIYTDFDQTLVDSKFNPKTKHWDIGKPIEPIVSRIGEIQFEKEIVIWSSRPPKEWGEIRDWLDKEGIRYSRIVYKDLGEAYIDDRAFNPNCTECLERWDRKYEK